MHEDPKPTPVDEGKESTPLERELEKKYGKGGKR